MQAHICLCISVRFMYSRGKNGILRRKFHTVMSANRQGCWDTDVLIDYSFTLF